MNAVPVETDRSIIMSIGGEEYELILTTRATKEIAKKYGGLEHLGDRILENQNFENGLDEIVWLITLLANQGVLRHNLANRENPRQLLTEEAVEVLTSPFDIAGYKDAILAAMTAGMKRNIISEGDASKNAADG